MVSATSEEHVYATLLLSDSYLPGALVLAHSLRDAGTTKRIAVLVTLDTVSADTITELKSVFDYIIPVPRIQNSQPANLRLMGRADLHSAFTKISLWSQRQFGKIVYIDADVVAYRAPDELFNTEHAFSAAPDIGWPDIFNTGVMVLTPNLPDYHAMIAMAEKGVSFDGADQGLLNMYFKHDFNRLSFTYNVTPSAHYQYIPAYRHFHSSISMVHFIGSDKPWFAGRKDQGDSPYHDMEAKWWSTYDRHYGTQASHDGLSQSVPLQVQYFTKGEWQPASLAAPAAEEHASDQQPPSTTHTGTLPPSSASSTVPAQQQTAGDGHGSQERQGHPQSGQHAASILRAERSTTESFQHHAPSWDAQRQPPPADSKPEALNFPRTQYAMSRDPTPFVPPARYPSPPKNMWYEVPKAPPTQRPRAIFPWEGQQTRASRTFAEDETPSVEATGNEPAPSVKPVDETPKTPTINIVPSDPWTSYTRTNAWDEVPEIGRYVNVLQRSRNAQEGGTSGKPTAGPRVASRDEPSLRDRRKHFKLTDFPSEVERPSLPVTPAPIARKSFWGGEDASAASGTDDAGQELPLADGVPSQSEWDPVAQLRKLAQQQQSDELLKRLEAEAGEASSGKSAEIPTRALPFGSEQLTSPPSVGGPAAAGPSRSAWSGTLHSPRPRKNEASTRSIRDIGEDPSGTGSRK